MFAALTHLGTVLAHVSMGAISLWARKVRWQELRRRTHQAAEAVREVEALEPVGA
jgi:hypothetical protein